MREGSGCQGAHDRCVPLKTVRAVLSHPARAPQINAEREYDRIIRSWKSELSAKQREFEALQMSMQPPRDLQLLKIQIQEELEVPYSQKISELEALVRSK